MIPKAFCDWMVIRLLLSMSFKFLLLAVTGAWLISESGTVIPTAADKALSSGSKLCCLKQTRGGGATTVLRY